MELDKIKYIIKDEYDSDKSYNNKFDLIDTLTKIINTKILIIDLKTTGLPQTKKNKKYYEPYDIEKYDSSRIIEISYMYKKYFNYNLIEDSEIKTFTRKPTDFHEISEECVQLHDITFKFAQKHGTAMSKILEKLFVIFEECDYVVCSNASLDINILLSEIWRVSITNEEYKITYKSLQFILDKKKYICIKELEEISHDKIISELFKIKNYDGIKKTVIILRNLYLNKCIWNTIFNIADNFYDMEQKIKIKNNYLKLNILNFNVLTSLPDNKIGMSENQIIELTRIKTHIDILCLQECENILSDKFSNYKMIYSQSHCGYTYLLINIELNPLFEETYLKKGIIISKVKTTEGILILGSIHLHPSDKDKDEDEDMKIRKKQIKNIQKWIKLNNYDTYPIIIGGDTNMKDIENNVIQDSIFDDVYCENSNNDYNTYPNKKIEYDKTRTIVNKIKNKFRFDRFLTVNCDFTQIKTVNTFDSDHLMILSVGQIDISKMKDHIQSNSKNIKDSESSSNN
jgi:DNA polymerase III epsilon subunit-like protein